jgi:predicted DNA-binding transcriptional regulator AlpA
MPETLLNTREVATYLQINEKQVYRLIRSGRIPYQLVLRQEQPAKGQLRAR